jgi:oligoribonuclease NrnB/cAMP/cGMP phosphodiesterase (DHH superfamily)
MKTIVIYHRADFDGIFCREIARKFLAEAELIGWDYGDPTPSVPPVCNLYILDLSVDELMDHGGLTWIDHHKSAIDRYPSTIPGYRIDGVAACRLAWVYFKSFHPSGGAFALPRKEQFINRELNEPLAVRLAGEYDIWDKRDERAEVFQFGLRSRELNDITWKYLLGEDRTAGEHCVSELLENGALLQRYQREVDAGNVKRGFEVEFEGKKFLALNTARCNSLTFESAAQPHHDGLMGFYFDGKQFVVSLYHSPHHKEHDLSAIAVKFGGGGHRGACGFRTKALPFLGSNAKLTDAGPVTPDVS